MSGAAARGAAGYLFASGRLGAGRAQRRQRDAERAAEALKQERVRMVELADTRVPPYESKPCTFNSAGRRRR